MFYNNVEVILMYDYNQCQNRDILCIDLKSFYASVSCILNGLDPMKTKLAVVGDTKRQGSVVLAATPPLKALGIKTGSRLFEIPQQKDIYITNPKMRTYMNISTKISKAIMQYAAPEDFWQYSIDECFCDVTNSYHLFASSPFELAKLIQDDIFKLTGVKSTVGIGSNMLLAKVSMDIEAKHTKHGIAEWRYQDVPTKLWAIDNLTDFWGINKKTAAKLNKRGIFTIKDLANYPYPYLKRDFGIIGIDLHLHANGIDESVISKPYKTKKQGLGKSQILLRDYRLNEIKTVLIEHVDEVFYRTRLQNKYPTTISVALGYTAGSGIKKQFTEKQGYQTAAHVIEKLWQYIKSEADPSALYRTISVNFTNFKDSRIQQLELFKSDKEVKEEMLDQSLDGIKLKYGQNIVTRAISLKNSSTLSKQKTLLAGHKA
jgi:DNA polymerase V